jgi:WS/DGAT/MGAT family acyltransferase
MDDGRPPEQFAAVLVIGAGLDLVAAERLFGERIAGVPRLRQRLMRTPLGCGRAIWVDDGHFDQRNHLSVARCRAPGDDDALLETILPLVMEPLPRNRPLWRAVFVHGLAGHGTALALIVHHVLADGLGGIAVLDRLLDDQHGGAAPTAAVVVAQQRPTVRELAADAMRARLDALRAIRLSWRLLRLSKTAGGGIAPARAEPCSLVRPTGSSRSAVVVHSDLPTLRDAAHRYGGTSNAALLSAVASALGRVLQHRRETVTVIVMAIPVGARRPDDAPPGNAVSPLLVAVPTTGTAELRIKAIADEVRHRRPLATGPAPIALLGALFRLVAGLGGYRWYMRHQRRLHTVVSYVRGPGSVVRFAGSPVRYMIPLVVGGATNVTVSVQAISYAETLTVTVVADPELCPDLRSIASELRNELRDLSSSSPLPPPCRSGTVDHAPAG